MCVCVRERERERERETREREDERRERELFIGMFLNFHVLYACIFAHSMFFFKSNCKEL